MLYIVLILVLGALGLLVTALITANSLWAWVSIVLSVVAGLVLVADFLRRRAARRPGRVLTKEPAEPAETTSETESTEDAKAVPDTDEPGEPEVEQTSTADVSAVAKLEAQVVVVDEHPRYHLTECTWLSGRETIPISVKEARDLGFTPCARCTPDAKLLATAKS